MFLYIKRNKTGLLWDFMEQKNCYEQFPMISGHRTEQLLSMGFEILGLGKSVILVCKKPLKG